MAVQKPITEIEQIEEKLVSFSKQVAQSSSVLDNLSAIQVQFEDLAQTYESFKDYSAKVRQKNQNFEIFKTDTDQRLDEIEKAIKSIQTAFGNLQQDWENPREAVEIYLDNMETRLRTELRGALSQLDQSGFSQAQIDKLDKLDTQVRALRTTLRATERRGRILQNWLVATSIIALLGLGMPLLMPFVRPEKSSPTPKPEAPKQEATTEETAPEDEAAEAPSANFSNSIGG